MAKECGQRMLDAFAETWSTVCDAFAQPLDEELSHVWSNPLPLQQDGTGDGGDEESGVVLAPVSAPSEECEKASIGPPGGPGAEASGTMPAEGESQTTTASAGVADDESNLKTAEIPQAVRIEQGHGAEELSRGQVLHAVPVRGGQEETNDNSGSRGGCMRASVSSWLDHLSYRLIWTFDHFVEISWQARVWILMSAVALVYALFAVIVALVSWNGSEHCRAALGEHAVPTWILCSVMHIPIALSLARVSLRGCEEYTPKLVLGLLLFPLCVFGVIGAVAISPTHDRKIATNYIRYGQSYTNYTHRRCDLNSHDTPSVMWVLYIVAVVAFSLICCVTMLIPCCRAYRSRLRGIVDEEALRPRPSAPCAIYSHTRPSCL